MTPSSAHRIVAESLPSLSLSLSLIRPAATCYRFPVGREAEAKFPRSRAPALIQIAIPAIDAHEY